MLEDPYEYSTQPASRFWKWTRIGWTVFLALVVIGLISIAGCAEDRFMTKEQDEEFRQRCEQGCAVVPMPVWKQIERALGISGS